MPGNKRQEQWASGTYKTSFANRDMTVNKQYAKYLERFGSQSVPTGEAPPTSQNNDLN